MVAKLSEAQRKRGRAACMLRAGKPAAQILLAVGVARQTVYTWKRLLDESGVDGLRARVESTDQGRWTQPTSNGSTQLCAKARKPTASAPDFERALLFRDMEGRRTPSVFSARFKCPGIPTLGAKIHRALRMFRHARAWLG